MENKITIKYVTVSENLDLKNFINNAGNSLETFRYFNKRSVESIVNHAVTILGYFNDIPVAYGHLDKENEDIWLGICVSENYKNKGFGKLIMSELIKYGNDHKIKKIKLIVDKNNINAINLYEKFNFFIVDNFKENVYLMELNLY